MKKLTVTSCILATTLLFSCKGTPSNESFSQNDSVKEVVQSLPSVKSLSKNSFVADRIFFKFDDAKVTGQYSPALKAQARYIKAQLLSNPEATIVVEGYCDERGSVEYNIELGLKRANSAKTFLVSEGVPSEKIKIVSFGKEKKLVDGTSSVAYLQNRAALTKIKK